MAASQMSSHMKRVRQVGISRLWCAKVWAINFAVGDHTIDRSWPSGLMQPYDTGGKPAYCNVGAGVASSSNGRTYYILQAA
jgi:hypothetical protein